MKDIESLWWNPLESIEELANFVVRCQGDKGLDEIYIRAQDRLRERRPDLAAFRGYNVDTQGVHAQIEAIYNAVASLGIGVTPRVATLPQLGEQYVRPPHAVLQQKEANCIDSAVTLSALLLKAGLNPLIIMVGGPSASRPGHSLLGCWLEDRQAEAVRSQWAEIRAALGRLLLIEPLGALDGECRLSFSDAVTEAMWSLPLLDRGPDGTKPRFTSRTEKRVFYVVDIKAAMIHPPPVIAIMGAKGGVGKTTLACRMAELIAEKGNDVMLVDLDVESAGSTTLHRRRARHGAGPGVATVYDHLKHLHRKAGADDSRASVNRTGRGADIDEMELHEDPALDPLEDVTPAYLDRRGLGRIYILPARPFSQVADRWESVANLPSDIRNELLLGELKRMMDRGNRAPLEKRVDCILFDCGAEFNPLVSAAFHQADYGFVIGNPDPICTENIADFDRAHRRRFRTFDPNKVRIIVNRVQTEEQKQFWDGNPRLAGIVPDSPELQQDWFKGEVYFDLGYGDVSRHLVSILETTLRPEHRSQLVPDEISTWVAPWWNLIKERELPARILDPKKDPLFRLGQEFRRATWTARIGASLAALLIIFSAYLLYNSPDVNTVEGKVAAVSFDSAGEGAAALARIQSGLDLFALAAERKANPFIGSPDLVPGIRSLDGIKNCMKATASGGVCSQLVTEKNKFYVIKVLQKADDVGDSKGVWLPLAQKGLAILLLLASIIGLGRFLLLGWIQYRKTSLLRKLQSSQSTEDLVKALDSRQKKTDEPTWQQVARDALSTTIKDHERKVALMGSLATDRPLIDFVIKRKEMARWLHDLLEADRQEQKLRRRT